METELAGWTLEEQSLAREVFDRAMARHVQSLIEELQRRCQQLRRPEDIWELHDFLSIRRHEIEGRFDLRLSGLLFVFADLVKEGLVSLEELQDFSADKRAKISAMARM